MLPFGGQGANCAIEDGGALGYVLKNVTEPASIPSRLELFQNARKARAARVQILSSVRAGKELEVEDDLREWADPKGSSECTSRGKAGAISAQQLMQSRSTDKYDGANGP